MKEIFYKLKKMNSARILIYLGIALILVGGSSFAYLNFFVEGSETNLVRSGCFETSFEESSALNLTKQVPISDDEGKVLTPYTFTIKNVCELDANYVVSFNTLTTSNEENNEKVKVYLTGDKTIEPTLVSELEEMTFLEVHNGLNKSFLLDEGTLQQNDTKTYELRMWIDYDATSFTGTFDSKILVSNINEGGELYTPIHKLTLDLDGGMTSDNLPMKVIEYSTVTLSVPTKTDYVFAGWDVSGTDLTTTGNTITMGENDATATAKWVKKVNTFDYTGSAPTTPYIAVPGSYKLEVWGAQGGGYSSGSGGAGGYTSGILTVTEDTNLYVYVGGAGSYTSSNARTAGGFNGGGYSGYGAYAGSGGGATDIRIGNTGTAYRVIVAGGGGGGGYYSSSYYGTGGAGGSTGGAGYNKYYASTTRTYGCGQGGSSTAGGYYGYYSSSSYGGSSGSFGTGGSASSTSSTYSRGGGGGGGWYGGGGAGYYPSSYYYRYICGGGGGSSYAYTTSHSASSLDSKYYLTSASYTSGARSGNGTATITVMSINY